jgi:hypothetical protein
MNFIIGFEFIGFFNGSSIDLDAFSGNDMMKKISGILKFFV